MKGVSENLEVQSEGTEMSKVTQTLHVGELGEQKEMFFTQGGNPSRGQGRGHRVEEIQDAST